MGRSLSTSIALCVALGLTGCSEGGPTVQYVEGIVTLDGQPVEGATVNFSPLSSAGTAAVGITDANGVYKLTAIPNGYPEKGTTAGDYTVTIMKHRSDAVEVSVDDPDYGKSVPSESAAKVERVIPQRYEAASTSGLTVTVNSGTNKGGEFNFDLRRD